MILGLGLINQYFGFGHLQRKSYFVHHHQSLQLQLRTFYRHYLLINVCFVLNISSFYTFPLMRMPWQRAQTTDCEYQNLLTVCNVII